MAVKVTSLGFKQPDGNELLSSVDEFTSHNAGTANKHLLDLRESVMKLNTALLTGTQEEQVLIAEVIAAVEARTDATLADPSTAAGALVAGKIDGTTKGAPQGVASLDGKGDLVASQLPAMLDYEQRTPFRGPLAAWGAALRDQKYRAAVWVNAGSSTANGGNVTTQTKNWMNRISAALTDRPRIRLEDVPTNATRPANGVQVYNRAVGGTHSGNYLTDADVTKIGALQADLITHMILSNDYAMQVPVETAKANLTSWVTKIRAVDPGAVQVLIHQQPRYDVNPGNGKIWSDYGRAMKEVAESFPNNVLFLNVAEQFEVMGTTPRWGVVDTDNIHLMDHGNRMLADIVGEFLGTPKIGYLQQETYSTTDLAGGSSNVNGKVFATIEIPKRPYPRDLVLQASVFAGTDAGSPGDYQMTVSDTSVLDSPSASSMFVRCAAIGSANRQTYSGTLHLKLLPNRAATVVVKYSTNSGTLYLSGTSTYSSITAALTPA